MNQHGQQRLSQSGRITGPGAASQKYDILTALLVTASQSDPVTTRLALRLSLVITARFNWRSGSFAVGLRELAKMWGVTERTAKRDMAHMRARNWIRVEVPSARGRVARYALELPHILNATMPYWSAVGPDFAARMAGAPEPSTAPTNVVPLHPDNSELKNSASDGNGWSPVAAYLLKQDRAVYQAWFSNLQPADCEAGKIILYAPSRFAADYVNTHYRTRIAAAFAVAQPSISQVVIVPSPQENV